VLAEVTVVPKVVVVAAAVGGDEGGELVLLLLGKLGSGSPNLIDFVLAASSRSVAGPRLLGAVLALAVVVSCGLALVSLGGLVVTVLAAALVLDVAVSLPPTPASPESPVSSVMAMHCFWDSGGCILSNECHHFLESCKNESRMVALYGAQ
jgi:hypothetical protein